MNFSKIQQNHWKQVKEIYMEAFPKRERKPFHSIYHSVQKGKAAIFTALEENTVLGFIMAIPYENMIMVDYLAVPSKIRSKGTGSLLIQEICRHFSGRKIVLLIERLDPCAENHEQRIARRISPSAAICSGSLIFPLVRHTYQGNFSSILSP